MADRLGDRARPGVELATVTTLRVGGPARAMVVAEDDGDLGVVADVAQAHEVPVMVVGRGSNLLVGDDGWPGIALQLGRGFRGVSIDGGTVVAGAAEPLPALAGTIARAGLAGFAWGTAVPGTLGGAVRMNAGAHGRDMSDSLVEVEVYRLGRRAREVWPAQVLGLSYRHSDLPADAVVVAATLALEPGDQEVVRAEMADIRSWRRTHQPLNEPNCGSVFTNPPDDSAGRLVEAAGAKGLAVGGARVSERHANFIVTRPDARAADVVALVRRVHALVLDETGVDLVPEVRVAGSLASSGAWWR
nr:UDP-N-acetylmuramate dehydrogenase [Salsipaludibacter albus]